MNIQESRERAAKLYAARAELPNDDCPLLKQAGCIWVAHECGRDLELVARIA